MTPDLKLLVWTVALALVQVLVAVLGALTKVPLPTLAANREDATAPSGWAGRAQRAHRNMLENLPLFTALILVAHIADRVNPTVILGAEIFFWARLVHAVVYLLGIPWLRTLVWGVSVVGLVLIFAQLLQA